MSLTRFGYEGILDVRTIQRDIGFNPEREYILTYLDNGENKVAFVKGSELTERFKELNCFGVKGSLEECGGSA